MNESSKGQQRTGMAMSKGILGIDTDLVLFEGGPTGRGVYADLRARIVKLDLPPGTPLLRIFPQSRTLVTPIDTTAIREAQFMRIALETEVVRQLAQDVAPDDLARLRSIVTLQASIGDQPDEIPTFQELDEVFHQTLFVAAGHVQSQRIMRSHAGHLERLRRLHLDDNDTAGRVMNNKAVIEGHTQILDGIEAGDVERAMDALRRHLQRTVNRMAEKRAAFPEYFVPEKP